MDSIGFIFNVDNDMVRGWVENGEKQVEEFYRENHSLSIQKLILYYALKNSSDNRFNLWIYALTNYSFLHEDVALMLMSLKKTNHFILLRLFKNNNVSSEIKLKIFNKSSKVKAFIALETHDVRVLTNLVKENKICIFESLFKNRTFFEKVFDNVKGELKKNKNQKVIKLVSDFEELKLHSLEVVNAMFGPYSSQISLLDNYPPFYLK